MLLNFKPQWVTIGHCGILIIKMEQNLFTLCGCIQFPVKFKMSLLRALDSFLRSVLVTPVLLQMLAQPPFWAAPSWFNYTAWKGPPVRPTLCLTVLFSLFKVSILILIACKMLLVLGKYLNYIGIKSIHSPPP